MKGRDATMRGGRFAQGVKRILRPKVKPSGDVKSGAAEGDIGDMDEAEVLGRGNEERRIGFIHSNLTGR